MNSRIKDFIGVAAVLGVIFFAYAAWVYVDAFSKSIEPSSFRSFSVSAESEMVAIPDIAQFSFSVITQGGVNIASLQTQNVEKVNNAITFVKSQGVEDKDIKTQNFSLEPRYQSFSCARPFGNEVQACPPPEIVGYTITQTVQVKVRDFAKIGTIVSGVVEHGANSVSQLSFTIDNPDTIESAVRTQAIQKAKEKAEAVARAGGFKVGRLLSIQEDGGPIYPFYEKLDTGFGGVVPASAPSPVIEPGSQKVKVFVTLVYEIQ
ncbi:MAG: SIMPL domain-containing protein [Patescibacteria group bacterium]